MLLYDYTYKGEIQMTNKFKNTNTGVTLVALVITIIILLILAGIVINNALSDNGIIKRAQLTKNETEDAINEEEIGLQYYQNEIDKRTNNSNETVTISKQEYEDLKNKVDNLAPKSINENSNLMTSINENLNIGTLTLKDFTNTFSTNFTEYFSYDNTTGEITCIKDGWFCIFQKVDLLCRSSTWTTTALRFYVNDIEISIVQVIAEGAKSATDNDSSSSTIYLKKGDILKFRKITSNTAAARNQVYIKILKL